MFRPDVSARPAGALHRALAFLFMLCLLVPSASPLPAPAAAGEPACAGTLHPLSDCAHGGSRSAEKSAHAEIDTLPGTPGPGSRRGPRRWSAHDGNASGPVAAVWLSAPAHHPPKTLRCCTFLL